MIGIFLTPNTLEKVEDLLFLLISSPLKAETFGSLCLMVCRDFLLALVKMRISSGYIRWVMDGSHTSTQQSQGEKERAILFSFNSGKSPGLDVHTLGDLGIM